MGKRVTHLVAGLGLGGAETMIYQLLLHRKDMTLTHNVISLGAADYYEGPIRELGIELTVLPFKKKPIYSLRQIRKQIGRTDTLCCWMYYGNLIGELSFLGFHKRRGKRIIWNVRHSNLDKGNVKRAIIITNNICARLSRRIDVIAYNGSFARSVHESKGYSKHNGIVLENGCDISKFFHDNEAGAALREELGIKDSDRMIMSVAKDDPIKDIPSFLKAFSAVHKKHGDTVAVMCGNGVTEDNEKITGQCNKLGLEVGKNVFLLGLRHDIARLLSGCDLYVLHSAGEAFPNTLIQAMACEALCVTTDVGDAKRILGDPSLVAKPKDPRDISERIDHALSLNRDEVNEKKRANREKVLEHYDIDMVVREYEKLY